MKNDQLWRAHLLLDDAERLQETREALVEAGFSIAADVLSIAAAARKAPVELQDKLHAAFLDLIENAPLDFWGTGGQAGAKREEKAWEKRVRKVKRLIMKIGRLK